MGKLISPLPSGTILKIYEDPITRKIPEGVAKILEFVDTLGDGLEEYLVHFVGDPDDMKVVRKIRRGES
jgi:hypothetical protein